MEKVGRILTFQWEFQNIQGSNYLARLLHSFMYQFYIGDNAIFWVDEGAASGNANRLYLVAPPYSSNDGILQQSEQFAADWVINLARIAGWGVGCFVDFTKPGREPDLKVHKSEGKTTLEIKKAFFERFFSTLPQGVQVVGVDLGGTRRGGPEV